jgi:hypothetical protein
VASARRETTGNPPDLSSCSPFEESNPILLAFSHVADKNSRAFLSSIRAVSRFRSRPDRLKLPWVCSVRPDKGRRSILKHETGGSFMSETWNWWALHNCCHFMFNLIYSFGVESSYWADVCCSSSLVQWVTCLNGLAQCSVLNVHI